jgi:hypothetical protein
MAERTVENWKALEQRDALPTRIAKWLNRPAVGGSVENASLRTCNRAAQKPLILVARK